MTKKILDITLTIKAPKMPKIGPVQSNPKLLAQIEKTAKSIDLAFARMYATLNSAEERARIDREMLAELNAHRCPICGIPAIPDDEPACVMCIPRPVSKL
jgi:hypothetical protein